MNPLKKQLGFSLPIAILIVVVLIVVALIAVEGARYYSYKTFQELREVVKEPEIVRLEQVVDETADWEIYRNEEYGFEVKYPANCSIEEITGESAFCPGDTKGIERLKYFEIKDCNTFVDIYNNPNNLGFGEWDDIYHTLTCTGSGFFSERIPFSLNEVLAIKGLFGCCAQGQKAVAISKDKKVYIIYSRDSLDFADDSPDKKEREDWLKNDITKGTDIFSQILSTFRFIEKISKEFIEVTQPKSSQKIVSPFRLEGEIRVSEKIMDKKAFIEVRDENDHILLPVMGRPEYGNSIAITDEGGPFSVEISYAQPSSKKGTIKIFVYIPTEGFVPREEALESWSPKTLIEVPIIFGEELLIIPADWNTYTNPEANFTFRYPKNWEIREEYFYKEAENPTVVVCRQEEPIGVIANCIQINMPQFPSKTVREIKGNRIGICVEDPEISEVYYQVINSFRCIEDETADWKVYRNEEYGFELKYPKEWSFEEGGAPRSPIFSYHWNENNYCQFNIVVIPVDYGGEMAWHKEKGYKETRYTIGGVPAIGFSKSSERKDSEAQHIFFDKNSNYYRITQSNSKGTHETECSSIFNQILSTFKFIK